MEVEEEETFTVFQSHKKKNLKSKKDLTADTIARGNTKATKQHSKHKNIL